MRVLEKNSIATILPVRRTDGWTDGQLCNEKLVLEIDDGSCISV